MGGKCGNESNDDEVLVEFWSDLTDLRGCCCEALLDLARVCSKPKGWVKIKSDRIVSSHD